MAFNRVRFKNWVDIVNIIQPSWININHETLIDHFLTTKSQNLDTITLEQSFGNDQFSQLFVSSFDFDNENG